MLPSTTASVQSDPAVVKASPNEMASTSGPPPVVPQLCPPRRACQPCGAVTECGKGRRGQLRGASCEDKSL